MTLGYETDTYEDLAQDFYHPRAHALGPPRECGWWVESKLS